MTHIREKIDKFGVMLGELLGVDEIPFHSPYELTEPQKPQTKTIHIIIEKEEPKTKTLLEEIWSI